MQALLQAHHLVQTTEPATVQEAGLRLAHVSRGGDEPRGGVPYAEERLPLGHGVEGGEHCLNCLHLHCRT